MSLCSPCLPSMRSLMLRILPCIPWHFHILHVGSCRSIQKMLENSLQVLILHPRNRSSWTSTLLPFILGYFFISGRLCINDVTQQCQITTVCLRPLDLFGIQYYSSSWIISHSNLSRWIYRSLYILLKLFLLLWCLWLEKLQVPLHVCLLESILNYLHLFFGTSLILIFL